MNYIISQYLVFEKNDQGGILPETRWSRRTRLYNEGRAEALSNWKEYDNDTRALTQLNNALQNNGQTITDNAERQKIADKTLKNASERAKEYGNQIVANTKTLSDFKKENEVEDPNKQVKPKFTDGLKSFASSALSSIGNAVVSAGTAMIAQQLISWGLQGIDAIVHWDDNIIAKGKEAKETILEQNQTYKDQKSQLEELQEQYTKYASGVKISGNIIKNATLSDEDFQAFLDTSNQIANLAPSMIDGWDSEGNAILKFGTDTKEANQQISDYIQLQRDVTHLSIRDNLQDEYKGVVKDAEKTGKEISNKKDQKKEADTIASGWTALKNATETDGPITFTTTAPQKEVEELGNDMNRNIVATISIFNSDKSLNTIKDMITDENRTGFKIIYGNTQKDYTGMKIESISEEISNERSVINISLATDKTIAPTETTETTTEKTKEETKEKTETASDK